MAMRTASPWWASLVFGAGLLILFIGERIFGFQPTWRWVFDIIALLAIFGTIALRGYTTMATSGARRKVERALLLCQLGVLLSLILYLFTTKWGMTLLHLSEKGAAKADTVLTVLYSILIMVNGKITKAQVLVGYFGMLLLGSATLAIGLFASALTRQQLIAAVVAAAMVVVMCFIHLLGNKVDPPFKDVLEQIDLWWVHYQYGFMKGILNIKDVIYYVATTYFFLLLSIKTLEAKRWQ